LQMARCNTLYFQIFAGISCQLEYFGRQVFQNGRRVDGRRGSDSVSLVDRVFQEPVDTTDGELKTGLGTS
jgi:hypothetical protein